VSDGLSESQHARIQTICLLIVSTVAIATGLYWLRPVMIPFVLAVFFAFGLTPLIDVQIRYLQMPRLAAVIVTMVLSVVLLTLLGVLVLSSVGQLTANADAYQNQMSQLFQRVTAALPLERFGISPQVPGNPFSEISAGTVSSLLLSATNAIVDISSNGLLVLVFLFYLLLGRVTREQPMGGVWGEVEERIERYLVTKALLSGATGALVGSVLSLLGIDLALVFGLFAFLLNFIPTIGSLVATLLPVPVVLVSPDISATTATLAIALPAIIQFTIGNIIEPKVMGEVFDLHPVTVIMALIVWGVVWGIVGMLLATPMIAIMKILFERMELTKPIADLLAGRLDVLLSGEKPTYLVRGT
jgi:AI-2 transport protein TqsA